MRKRGVEVDMEDKRETRERELAPEVSVIQSWSERKGPGWQVGYWIAPVSSRNDFSMTPGM